MNKGAKHVLTQPFMSSINEIDDMKRNSIAIQRISELCLPNTLFSLYQSAII